MTTIQIKKVNASQARIIVATGERTTIVLKVKRKIDLAKVPSTANVRKANEQRRTRQRLANGPFAALTKLALCCALIFGGNLSAQTSHLVPQSTTLTSSFVGASSFHHTSTDGNTTVSVWITRGKDCVVVNSTTTDPTGKVLRSVQCLTETQTAEENGFVWSGLVRTYAAK